MSYEAFLSGKAARPQAVGHEPGRLHPSLYPFQRDITRWAIRRGRAAIFADCGMGKTRMQLEWARQIRPKGGRVLIVCPLAVAEQTQEEGHVLGIDVARVTAPGTADYQITNYQRLHHFVGAPYDALILDESSILKSIDGKTRTMLLREFTSIKYRLACTATPAPNDLSELANHSEFVGAMPRAEMLAAFFVHDADGRITQGWRLKGHAEDAFWRWVASWAVYVRRPSDVGDDDGPFILPALDVDEDVVSSDFQSEGMLFGGGGGLVGERAARKHSMGDRVTRTAELVQAEDGQAVVWCGLNDEGRLLAKALGADAVLIEGATDDDEREALFRRWRRGEAKTLITKPSMFGFGLNLQFCHRVFFLGIGHSYEQYYQAVRRCWRFGQTSPVDVRIVVSEAEVGVAANVRRKEQEAAQMAEGIVMHMKGAMDDELHHENSAHQAHEKDEAASADWRVLLGDSVERIKELADDSVGLSVFSPPFAALYTYSASERDMGNSKDYDQFFGHFNFLIPELLRVTMPGRRCCVHVQQVTTTKATHGVIGWRDFRADVVRHFIAAGWVYDGEVVIDKDPQAQAIRTKSKALMFVQKNKDSAWSRPAMADYILLFRAPGDNPVAVDTDVSNEEWILWARPIWYGIRESETLNAAEAREDKDERHLCPLQLETIERCVRLWSNAGEWVLDPFAGIGSTGYVALKHDRRFVGIELKRAYWRQAVRNVQQAQRQLGLFAGEGATA
jgi:DNA modification methylase/superfamily II DNA or RNA helicase